MSITCQDCLNDPARLCEACADQIRAEHAEVLDAPVGPLPAAVWQEVKAALEYEAEEGASE